MKTRNYLLTLLTALLALGTFGQNVPCSVSINSVVSPGGDCNGVTATLTADGQGAFTYAINNDFDNNTAGVGWSSNITADFSEPCDPSHNGGGYMWMGNSAAHPRIIETASLDLSCGGQICFYLDFATQGNASPCEGIDLAGEGVYLEYSTNGGATWTTIEYFGPAGVGNTTGNGGTNAQMTSWNQYCYTIPPGAQTANTIIHWAQTGSSGIGNDHWGIDDVSITSVDCNPYWYDWSHLPPNVDDSNQVVTATQTTWYTVTYTNGTETCVDSVQIVVPPGPIADAGPDQTFCAGSPAITIGGNPVNTDNGATYAWTNGAGNGTIGGGDNGRVNVTPAATTTYDVSVTFNGCTSTDQMTVTVDNPPTASDPPPINVECIGDVPGANVNVVTDEADDFTVPPTVTHVGDVSNNQTCPEIITRTYRVTDGCGNYVDVNQTITVQDVTAPVFAAPPADVTVDCFGNVPAMTNLGWTDNCDGAGNVAGTDGALVGTTCNGTITRTWTYTDACGNTASVSQNITINDSQAPVLDPTPADVTVECPGDVPAMVNLGWTDNCDGAGTVAGMDVSDGMSCPETITRTWTYTDACGNTATTSQTITVIDTQAPVFVGVPGVTQVECAGDVPPMIALNYTDNCDPGGNVMGVDVSDGQTCPEVITRTWTYTDNCGNTGTASTTITIIDTQAPVLDPAPADVTVECIGDVPAMTNLNWTDNCDGAGTVAGTDTPIAGGNCGGTITRTWTYTDACGNVATATQTITVNDTQAPVLDPAPADVTVECIGDVPAMTNLNWTDNCDGAGVVAGTDGPLTGGACGGTITRTWTYTDACGNVATVTQTITVDDTTPPTGSNPATVNLLPGQPVPPADPLVVTDEADNCTAAPTVTHMGDVSDGMNCPETITRTYRITDDCGNFTDVIQLITIQDAIAPTASNPPTINVPCIANVPAPDPLVVTDEADNGGVPVVTWEDDNSDGLTCPETITRRYRVTDNCNNYIFVTQLIVVNVDTGPVVPADDASTVECISHAVQPAAPIVTDQCGNNIVPVITASADPNCEGTKTYTYTYTDCAGNIGVYNYTYTIDLNTAPVVPANMATNVDCITDIVVPTAPVVTDACGNNITPVMTENADPLCVGDKIYTFTYTDCAGNVSVYTYTYTINDNTPPTASNPAAIAVPGAMDVPVPDVTVVIDEADNCTTNPVVAWVNDVSDGNICNGEIITRTYSVTDDCGNSITVIQEITILATYPPIDAGPDQIICQGDGTSMTATNPWGMPMWWDNNYTDGSMTYPTASTMYTVTADNLGCISQDSAWIIVEELPVVSFIGDNLSGCIPTTVTFTNTSTTSSSLVDCIWDIEGGPTVNDCAGTTFTFTNAGLYDVTLTTTSINGCTNSVTYSDYIYIEDFPVAAFDISSTALSSINPVIELTNNSTGASTYSWNFGDGNGSTLENPTHTYSEELSGGVTIDLIVYSPLGCPDSTSASITIEEELIFYVPNTFTPDHDDFNETFQPVFHSGYDPFDFTLTIFNRWGEIIFESHDANIGWDGSYGGRTGIVSDGVYTWKIEFKTTANDERKMVTGHVNVIR